MDMQELIIARLINNIRLGAKISSANDIYDTGKLALDATEKNENIDGTLAHDIKLIKNSINNLSVGIVSDDSWKDEVEALKKSVSDGKSLVANAITGKGVNTATDATFSTLAGNIGNLCSVMINNQLSSKLKINITKIAHISNLSSIIPSQKNIATMPTGLCFQDGSVFNYNGGVILIGVRTTSGGDASATRCYRYDYNNDNWTQLSSLPIPFNTDCAVLYNNEIHIFQETSHYKFDGTEWKLVSTIPISLTNSSGFAMIFNGYIHLLVSSILYKFNGTSWQQISTLSISGSTISVNRATGCVGVLNNEIHVITGNAHYKYTSSGSWVKRSITVPMTIPSNGYPESVIIDNNIFVITKNSASTETTQNLYCYSYKSDSWSLVGALDKNYSGGSAIYIPENNKLYFFGGNYNSNTYRTAISFNISTEDNEYILDSVEEL